MIIEVKRTFKGTEYTIGKLYIDGAYFCDTLEDTVRPAGQKIAGKTAIPAGKYHVKKTMSPRFKRILPEILNVPNFAGVRIHEGNYADHRELLKIIDIPKKFAIIKTQEHIDVI